MKATCKRVPTNISPNEETTLVMNSSERNLTIAALQRAVRVMVACGDERITVNALTELVIALTNTGK